MPLDVGRARAFFAAVKERPGMHFSSKDWRYATAAAYVQGWIVATDPSLNREFSAWLGEPSIAWWGTIFKRRYPERAYALSELEPEADALLLDDLFEALDRYLASLEA